MFYGGENNVPGAPGNVGAYGNALAGTWTRDPFPQGQQQGVNELFRRGMENTEKGRQMQENIQRLRQTLPQAMGVGNMGGMLAQANPNAAALGGLMQAGEAPTGFGMQAAPNVFSVRPKINYMEPEQGGLELGGGINVPIGERGRINVQGGYQPETSRLNVNATIGQPPGSPGFGIDFNMNRMLRPGSRNQNDYGVMGRYGTQF